jgi:hypothetical protein
MSTERRWQAIAVDDEEGEDRESDCGFASRWQRADPGPTTPAPPLVRHLAVLLLLMQVFVSHLRYLLMHFLYTAATGS